MFQTLFISIFFAVLISCNTNKQVKKSNPAISIQLFEEGSDLMMKGFKSEVRSSDSSQFYYEQAIEKFLTAYESDTSNTQLGLYLPDMYAKLGKWDSSKLWTIKLRMDSISIQKDLLTN